MLVNKSARSWICLLLAALLAFGVAVPAGAEEEDGKFSSSKPTTNGFGISNKQEITVSGNMKGGELPYFATVTLYADGKKVASKTDYVPGKFTMGVMPTRAGKYTVQVVVGDCAGNSDRYELSAIVAEQPRYETANTWEASIRGASLTGNYANDLLAIAETQVGYTADNAFIFQDGYKAYYSRYGEWYGVPYGNWCVMFISFCANYAGILGTILPRHASSSGLMSDFQARGAYHTVASGYVPAKGDIVFMDYIGKGQATHAGIVRSGSIDTVQTIEGNTSKGVAKKSYSRTDPAILGFGSLQEMAGY